MRALSDLASHLGRLPARRVTWALALVFSAWIVLDVMELGMSARLARPTYDAMVRARFWSAPPDPRIVIVDIDEASLARMAPEFGRWPWPRDTLATLLDHLEKQNPAAIVWDIAFSDADRMSPGGDAAFNQASAGSAHSHFSVVRLPAANDVHSEMRYSVLPALWSTQGRGTATLALVGIAPTLPALAAARVGYNNGEADRDGVLRRYRYSESLPDGGVIQSIALSVVRAIDPGAAQAYLESASGAFYPPARLVAWRGGVDSYPHIPFADLFAQAESAQAGAAGRFTGKVVLVGATAPSLHDMHPTPLSASLPGVDTLATVIDNALNRRYIAELPRAAQAALAVGLCVGIALWAQFKSIASLDPLLWLAPAGLLGLGFLTLNGAPLFLDLQLVAGLALVFIALLRFFSNLRRSYWCSAPVVTGPVAVWPWLRATPWLDTPLDRLIDAVEKHAPECRVMVLDAHPRWPGQLRWPELARFAALVGPADALLAARPLLEPVLRRLARHGLEPATLAHAGGRDDLAACAFSLWSQMQKPLDTPATAKAP